MKILKLINQLMINVSFFWIVQRASLPGSYVVETVKLEMGKLQFMYNVLQEKKQEFKIIENASSLKVKLSPPEHSKYKYF